MSALRIEPEKDSSIEIQLREGSRKGDGLLLGGAALSGYVYCFLLLVLCVAFFLWPRVDHVAYGIWLAGCSYRFHLYISPQKSFSPFFCSFSGFVEIFMEVLNPTGTRLVLVLATTVP